MFSCCPTGTGAVYEVAIRFTDPSIKKEYANWLSSRHINEVLQCDGFLSAELLSEYKGDGLVVRYVLESPAVFDNYDRSEIAKKLRQEAIEKFGSRFAAARRVLTSENVFFK